MKQKFSSMGRVAIALVLALSLSLVMAVPVSATHESTATISFQEGASALVSQASILDLTVTSSSGDSINEVVIDFSASDFTVTGPGTDPTGWTGSGPVAPAKVVTYKADAGYEIAPGALLAVTFSPAVTNPATAGDKSVPDVVTKDAGSEYILPASEDTGWIGYIALEVGDIPTITYVVRDDSFPLSVSVSDPDTTTPDITAHLAWDGEAGDPSISISTAPEVAAKINADAEASLLVDAVVATGHTDYVVQKMSQVSLKDGTSAEVDNVCAVTPATLTVIVAPFEVWVDAADGNDGNSGSVDFPVKTIAQGIAIAPAGSTVNVAAGTYTEVVTIEKQLTLKGANHGVNPVTATRGAESIIDGSALEGYLEKSVYIHAGNVILDGFTIKAKPTMSSTYAVNMVLPSAADGGELKNNIVTGGQWTINTTASYSSWVISNNCISSADTGSAIYLEAGTGALITGNLITTGGIALEGTVKDATIQNNTISNGTGSGVALCGGVDGLIITGNTFSGNLTAGVNVFDGATKVSTYEIYQNNFAATTTDGVTNGATPSVDAANNWWGSATGPTHTSNPDGTGATVTDLVLFTPWLTSEYGVEEVTTISLEVGWNLISLLLIPEEPDIEMVLFGLDVNKVAAYSPFQDWKFYTPGVSSDLAQMNDGWGYWVDMNTAGTLTVSGYEVCEPQAVPPTYDVAVGWNLIGFKSTTSKLITSYLGPAIAGTGGTLEAIYGYNATSGVYFIPVTNLEPGYGYWLAVNTAGKIYP